MPKPPPKTRRKRLTPKQLQAVKLLGSIPPEYKSFDDAADQLKVNRSSLYDWRMRHPAFRKALAKRLQENYESSGGMVRSALLLKIASGKDNTPAIKLFFQHAERWVERQGVEVDEKPIPIIQLPKRKPKKKK